MTDADKRYFGPSTPYAAIGAAAIATLIGYYLWLMGGFVVLLLTAVAASTMTMGGATRRIAMGIVIGGLGSIVAGVVASMIIFSQH